MSIGVPGLPIALLRGTFDPAAVAWATAVNANGGTYSASTIKAVSDFSRSAKASGYWTKLNRINLFCGNQLAAAMVPLKAGGGTATETNMNFVSGDYTESTGLTGDGATKYLKTGLIPSTSLTLNSTHLAGYSRSSTGSLYVGVSNALAIFAPFSDGKLYSDAYDSASGRLVSAAVIGTPYGFMSGSRTSATAHDIYRNGASVGTNATSGGALPAVEAYVFATNNAGAPVIGAPQSACAYSIGDGLTASDVAAYYTHLQAFQTALGRNV